MRLRCVEIVATEHSDRNDQMLVAFGYVFFMHDSLIFLCDIKFRLRSTDLFPERC